MYGYNFSISSLSIVKHTKLRQQLKIDDITILGEKNDDITILAKNVDDITILAQKNWRYYDIDQNFRRYYDIGNPPGGASFSNVVILLRFVPDPKLETQLDKHLIEFWQKMREKWWMYDCGRWFTREFISAWTIEWKNKELAD